MKNNKEITHEDFIKYLNDSPRERFEKVKEFLTPKGNFPKGGQIFSSSVFPTENEPIVSIKNADANRKWLDEILKEKPKLL